MKTVIAVPCMDKIDTAFVRCLLSMRKAGETAVSMLANSLVYMSREEMAKGSLESGADWLLFLDSDMVFGEDLFVRLLQAAEEEHADIVTALAFRRRPPFTPCIWETFDAESSVLHEFTDLPTGRFEIAACGMAGCLIRTEIFRRCFEAYRTCFVPFERFGEDLSFCIRAKLLGAKLICDSDVQMGHLSQTVVDRATYLAHKETKNA